MFIPNGFVLEQACFHVVNMFVHLNCPYQMYGIFLKPHNSLVLSLYQSTFLTNSSRATQHY